MTTSGVLTEFSIPTGASGPSAIAAGADGNLWFTENYANQVARITPGGVVTEVPVPTPAGGPYGITRGPDGNIWFTEFADRVARIRLRPPAHPCPRVVGFHGPP
jgi:virginiamycin B lyase